ncbi:hypothetical protein LLQ46_23065 [Rouxiella badensis]|nr:hypothetical protein [Rouxiella badensis]MCC3749743.1 hypothetical protein [Rouxiella badensis]
MDDYDFLIKQRKALAIVDSHGCSVKEFIEEMGDKSHYSLQDVRDWLGY